MLPEPGQQVRVISMAAPMAAGTGWPHGVTGHDMEMGEMISADADAWRRRNARLTVKLRTNRGSSDLEGGCEIQRRGCSFQSFKIWDSRSTRFWVVMVAAGSEMPLILSIETKEARSFCSFVATGSDELDSSVMPLRCRRKAAFAVWRAGCCYLLVLQAAIGNDAAGTASTTGPRRLQLAAFLTGALRCAAGAPRPTSSTGQAWRAKIVVGLVTKPWQPLPSDESTRVNEGSGSNLGV